MNLKTTAGKIRSAGREPVVTVRSGLDTVTPESLAMYEDTLENILLEVKPSFLSIEDNETSLIPEIMSLDTYIRLLKTALTTCSNYDTQCTNGGLEAGALITTYLSSWADKSTQTSTLKQMDENEQDFLTDTTYQETREKTANTVTTLLEEYKKMGIKSVNLHWNTYPIGLFIRISEIIREKYGLNTVSTEMEIPIDPARNENTLRSVKDMNLECVIWYFPFEGRSSKSIFHKSELTKLSRPLRNINRSLF